HTSLAATLLTRRRDYTSLTTAAFTHRDVDKLPEDGLLHTANLARTLASRTARSRCPRLRSIATTGLTGFPARELNLFLATEDRLLKGNRQFIAQISTALRP